jgi:hypothetical protein
VGPNYRPRLLVETLPEPTSLAGLCAGVAALFALSPHREGETR